MRRAKPETAQRVAVVPAFITEEGQRSVVRCSERRRMAGPVAVTPHAALEQPAHAGMRSGAHRIPRGLECIVAATVDQPAHAFVVAHALREHLCAVAVIARRVEQHTDAARGAARATRASALAAAGTLPHRHIALRQLRRGPAQRRVRQQVVVVAAPIHQQCNAFRGSAALGMGTRGVAVIARSRHKQRHPRQRKALRERAGREDIAARVIHQQRRAEEGCALREVRAFVAVVSATVPQHAVTEDGSARISPRFERHIVIVASHVQQDRDALRGGACFEHIGVVAADVHHEQGIAQAPMRARPGRVDDHATQRRQPLPGHYRQRRRVPDFGLQDLHGRRKVQHASEQRRPIHERQQAAVIGPGCQRRVRVDQLLQQRAAVVWHSCQRLPAQPLRLADGREQAAHRQPQRRIV